MHDLIYLFREIIERGCIFGLVVASVQLSSYLIKFDNLAIEGAFSLGSAVAAFMIYQGINPWLALCGALTIGALSGAVTGFIATKLHLNNLISGIVITAAAFSLSLKIAGSNKSLSGYSTIFTTFGEIPYATIIILICICLILFAAIMWFLQTEIGLLLHAVGDTPQMLINVGKNPDSYIMLGLMLSNALAALSGALFVQYVGYFSIWSSVGILIVGVAGMILSQIFDNRFTFAILLGSILYQSLITLTFELHVDQDWNKLITALLIIMLIMFKRWMPNTKGAYHAKA